MSTLVRVHRDWPLKYPPECIACGAAAPDSTARVLSWQSAENAFAMRRFDAPACAGCARALARRRRDRFIAASAGSVVALTLFGGYLMFGRGTPHWASIAMSIGVVGAVAIPAWYVQWRSPLPVRAVQRGSGIQQIVGANYITLSFADADYARRFAMLNKD